MEPAAKRGGEDRMKMQCIVMGFLLLVAHAGSAQSVRSLVNGGNDLYKNQKYADAEVNYRKALEKEKALVQGHFNLGNALAKQGKNDEAAKEYEAAMKGAEQNETKAYSHYNIGNTHMAAQQFGDAVHSYIDALKINPDDEEAKYNLSYALEKLRQQQQQQQQQNQQNKNDKNKQDQKKQNQQQDQNKKNQEKQKQDQERQRQQEKRMSQADAQRILDVLKNNEKDVQKKLRTRPAERPKTDKDW
jgi:Ca-activated chloride channel family protein